MHAMATEFLKLRRDGDGYHRTSWVDDAGTRRVRSFGKNRRQAQTKFSKFHAEWKHDSRIRNPDDQEALTIREAWERYFEHDG